jgi:DNA-binding FadR family transcriptional regulator
VIASIPQNPIFLAIHQALTDWVIDSRRDNSNFEELNEKSYLAHEEIFKCIENKDPIGADRVLGEHIEYVFENIYDMND